MFLSETDHSPFVNTQSCQLDELFAAKICLRIQELSHLFGISRKSDHNFQRKLQLWSLEILFLHFLGGGLVDLEILTV